MLRDALSIKLIENQYLVCSFVEPRNNSSIDTEWNKDELDTVYYLALN